MTVNPEPLRRLRELVDSLPQRVAEAAAQARELPERTVTGTAGQGAVTVSATGTGSVTEVRIAGRTLDSHTLGEYVTEATNAALDAADALRPRLPDGGAGAADEAQQAFERRMDTVLADLDRLSGELDGILGRAAGAGAEAEAGGRGAAAGPAARDSAPRGRHARDD